MSWRYKGGFIQAYFDPLTYPTSGLYSWGLNSSGQLGLNDTANRSAPVQLGALSTWTNVAVGLNAAIATKSDGTMWSWGANSVGQLGLNISYSYNRSSPVQVGVLTTWNIVSAGSNFSGAIKKDNTLWTWGRNDFGQLGQNTIINRSSPIQVGSDSNWAALSSRGSHSLAIKTNGTLWGFGDNTYGQIGDNTIIARSSPVQIGSETNWVAVSCGLTTWSAGLKSNGTLWVWGRNNGGQLGQNDLIDRSSPVQVGSLTSWSSVSCGSRSLYALKTDGSLWVCGINSLGQLGQNNAISRSSPVQVGSDLNWYSVEGATSGGFALKNDFTLWAWGANGNGTVGDGTVITKSSPVQVGSNKTWLTIGPASYSVAAIAKQ